MNLTLINIQLNDFATYSAMTHSFTPGLTMVLGNNGAGKSTIIEGVVYALYGRTLRGELPKMGASVALDFMIDDKRARIVRQRPAKGGGSNLQFVYDGNGLTAQTPSETQLKIEALVGSWESFAASRLFAREFMAKFAAATDKERKQLLEGILGLERFDKALTIARDKLAQDENVLSKADTRLSTLAEAAERQRALVAGMGAVEDPAELLAEIEQQASSLDDASIVAANLRNDVQRTQNIWREAIERDVAAKTKRSGLSAQVKELDAKRVRSQRLADCPVCLQHVGNEAHAGIEQYYLGQINPLLLDVATLTHEIETVLADLSAALTKEMQDYAKKLNAAESEQRECENDRQRLLGKVKAVEQRAKDFDNACAEMTKIDGLVADITARKQTAEVEVHIDRALVETFGLRGARVLLLGQALGALEGQTNSVLGALGLPLSVQLKTSTTLKSGKDVDALHVGVTGAGGGSYNAASAGEKARVDVALMLGLSALLGGSQAGFLAFDEVFDTLDQEGIERVAGFIGEMAEERQVIVISHHPDLRSLFPRGQILQAVKDAHGISTLGSL